MIRDRLLWNCLSLIIIYYLAWIVLHYHRVDRRWNSGDRNFGDRQSGRYEAKLARMYEEEKRVLQFPSFQSLTDVVVSRTPEVWDSASTDSQSGFEISNQCCGFNSASGSCRDKGWPSCKSKLVRPNSGLSFAERVGCLGDSQIPSKRIADSACLIFKGATVSAVEYGIGGMLLRSDGSFDCRRHLRRDSETQEEELGIKLLAPNPQNHRRKEASFPGLNWGGDHVKYKSLSSSHHDIIQLYARRKRPPGAFCTGRFGVGFNGVSFQFFKIFVAR
jgi:hypothetical protein